MSAPTFLAWKPTKEHAFSTRLSLPPGHEIFKSRWQSMLVDGSENLRRLLIANAIETNHIETPSL